MNKSLIRLGGEYPQFLDGNEIRAITYNKEDGSYTVKMSWGQAVCLTPEEVKPLLERFEPI